MIGPNADYTVALNRLRGSEAQITIVRWLEAERAKAVDAFIGCDNPEQLPVAQNTVRVLIRLINVLNGGTK